MGDIWELRVIKERIERAVDFWELVFILGLDFLFLFLELRIVFVFFGRGCFFLKNGCSINWF